LTLFYHLFDKSGIYVQLDLFSLCVLILKVHGSEATSGQLVTTLPG